ncbi:MAG: glutamate synthase large chain, partial [Methylobacteriaceae bacterium]|nr:glutamate synthase large chain [Methylobacteriaceae bacterium]
MEHERLNRSRGPSGEALVRAAARIDATDPALPRAQGLYDPRHEHDSCGVGFIADMANRKSHEIVTKGLQILLNLDHRGAVGADPKLGDGCGILVQIPHRFFSEEMAKGGVTLPEPREYGIGQFFMPRDEAARSEIRRIVERVLEEEGLTFLGWRDVPVDNSDLGDAVKAVEPVHNQVFLGRGPGVRDEDDFERRLYIARKVVSNAIYAAGKREMAEYYPVSMSCRTIVYKGMVLVKQL